MTSDEDKLDRLREQELFDYLDRLDDGEEMDAEEFIKKLCAEIQDLRRETKKMTTIAEERFAMVMKLCESQHQEIKNLREALEFYADKDRWRWLGHILNTDHPNTCTGRILDGDQGEIARKALGIEK